MPLTARRPVACALALATALAPLASLAQEDHASRPGLAPTTTPVKYLVVIFQENVSFDHYFATYPYAANTDGTRFVPPATPRPSTASRPASSPPTPTPLSLSVSLPRRTTPATRTTTTPPSRTPSTKA